MAFDPNNFPDSVGQPAAGSPAPAKGPTIGKSMGGFDPNKFGPPEIPKPDPDAMSSAEYRAEVLEPARQRAMKAIPKEELQRKALGQFMITNPISAIRDMFREEVPEEAEFRQKAAELKKIEEREDAEFSELYPEGSIRELDPFRLKNAPIGERIGVAARQLLIPDDAERARSLEKLGFEPQAVAGRYIIKDKKTGEPFVLNYPKLSGQDVTTFFSEGAMATPAGMYAGGARGAVSVLARTLAAGGLTATAQQGIQKALGGEFDGIDIALDTGFGLVMEGASRYLGNKIKQLSPQKKLEVQQTDSLIEMMDVMGVNEKQLKQVLTDAATSIPEKRAIAAQVEQAMSVAKLQQAVRADPQKAFDIEQLVDMENAAHIEGIRNTLGPDSTKQRQVMQAFRDANKALKKKKLDRRRMFTDSLYNDAFDGVESIDVSGLRDNLSRMRSLVNEGSEEAAKIDGYIRNLSPDESEVVVLSASGKEILDLKKDPQRIQDVLIGVRRVLNTTKNPVLKRELSGVEKEMTSFLNSNTGGKLAIADRNYAKVMDMNERMLKSFEGIGENVSDIDFGKMQELLFNPTAQQRPISNRYMAELRRANPAAADKMWGNYWNSKLSDLGPKPKPSDVRKALFDGPNHPADLAPNPVSARAIRDLESLVKSNENIENIGLNKAARQWAEGKMDPDIAHWVYVRMGLFRTLKGKRDKDLANLWFKMATDKEWSKRLTGLMDSSPIRAMGKKVDAKKKVQAAETLTKKVQALAEEFIAKNNMGAPSAAYLTSQTAPDVVSDAAETNEDIRSFNQGLRNLPNINF